MAVPLPRYVATCCAVLRRGGYAAYPVGGCVRDLLLGVEPDDWDVATSAPPEAVQRLFARTIPTGLAHGTVTVRLEHQSIEVTTFRREWGYSDGRRPDGVSFDADLEGDLARRDFTINAMAMDEDGSLLDPFGGRRDLELGLIRCVGDPHARFAEDALRMFRALRFAVRLGFRLEAETAKALCDCAPLVNRLAGERVRVEVEKTITSPRFAPLSHLPAAPIPRWAAFCALLGTHPADVLGPLKTETALRRAVCAGYDAAQTQPPQTAADWRRLLAARGEQAAIAAAAVLETQATQEDGSLTQATQTQGDGSSVFRNTEEPSPCVACVLLSEVLAEHPVRGVNDLALSGGDLVAMGYSGARIGAIQRALLQVVVESPAQNTRAALSALLVREFPL